MISIIIPAYNEAAVIERCLRALTDGAEPGELEVIVAANGCTDDTAARARAFGGPVRVVELARGSKPGALNAGDAAATGFPRCYIDADVEVGLDQVRRVAAMLEGDLGILAAAPAMRVDLAGSSAAVRAFYRVWLSRPFHGRGMIGGGFYALSRAGRARFDQFPDLIADDEFVRALFSDAERGTPADCFFTIRAPRTLRQLIKVKTRSRLGLYQLRKARPDLADSSRSKPRRAGGGAGAWLTRPGLWPSAAVYLLVNAVTRMRARRQLRAIGAYQWERDESSRTAAASAS